VTQEDNTIANKSELMRELLSITMEYIELDKGLFHRETPPHKKLLLGPFGPAIDFTFYRKESEKLSERLNKLISEKEGLDTKEEDYIDKLSDTLSTFTEVALRMEEKAMGSIHAKANNVKLISFKDFKKLTDSYDDKRLKLSKTALVQEKFGSNN
jgi:hypothetical protein